MRPATVLSFWFSLLLAPPLAAASEPHRQALPDRPDILLAEPPRSLLEEAQRQSRVSVMAIERELTVPPSLWRQVASGPDTIVWQLSLRSAGAAQTAVQLDVVDLPSGDKLIAYSPGHSETSAVYTGKGPIQMGRFSTVPMLGDLLVLEWHAAVASASPVRADRYAVMPFALTHLNHFFPPAARPQPQSQQARVQSSRSPPAMPAKSSAGGELQRLLQEDQADSLCATASRYQQYREQSAGVARLLIDGRSGCSGILLQSGTVSGLPGRYVLTADHCVTELYTPQPWLPVDVLVYWHDLLTPSAGATQLENCADAPEPPSSPQQGARLVAWDDRFDYALLWLATTPVESVRPQAWSGRRLPAGSHVFALHHAAENPQQLLEGTIEGYSVLLGRGHTIDPLDGRIRLSFDLFTCRDTEVCTQYLVSVSSGTSEIGTSGAGLFHRASPPGSAAEVVGISNSSVNEGRSGSFLLLHHALQLDERLRLALERGAVYYAECGPNADNQEASRAADCGTLRRERLCQVLDLDSRQCAAIVDFSLSPSMELWATTSAASVQGGESLVSKLFSDGRDACIELLVLMPAGETTFSWRVSSEQLFDRLVFRFDGAEQGRISGERNWEKLSAPVKEPGTHQLQWCYEKDNFTDRGLMVEDRAWLDALSFAPPARVSTVVLTVQGGAQSLITREAESASVFVDLSLASADGILTELTELSLQLQAMVSDDATVSPIGPVDIIVPGTTEVVVTLGMADSSSLTFLVSGVPTDLALEIFPQTFRVMRPSGPPTVDVSGDGRLSAQDAVAMLHFLAQSKRSDEPTETTLLRARLTDLLPPKVVDLRLDADGNSRVNAVDIRIMLRYLAGLRGSALAETVRLDGLEVLFAANR